MSKINTYYVGFEANDKSQWGGYFTAAGKADATKKAQTQAKKLPMEVRHLDTIPNNERGYVLMPEGAADNTLMMVMAAPKPESKQAAPKAVKPPAVLKVKVAKTEGNFDWAIRRLRNQAATYFAKDDAEKRKAYKALLEGQGNYLQVQGAIVAQGFDAMDWDDFMNVFFSAACDLQRKA